MPEIKTREVVKGTVKTLDRAAVAGERMKQAYVRTKDKAEQSVYAAQNAPEEYAADRVSGGVDAAAHEAVRQFDSQGRKAVKPQRTIFLRPGRVWSGEKPTSRNRQPQSRRRKKPQKRPGPLPRRLRRPRILVRLSTQAAMLLCLMIPLCHR